MMSAGRNMEHDIYGNGLEHFKLETGTRAEWGGAEQIAVFAHTCKINVEVHVYGMAVQFFDGGGLEQKVIRALYSNPTKWSTSPITMTVWFLMWKLRGHLSGYMTQGRQYIT
eukprot:9439082-Heterocapsa_arctica.AAC.1